MSSKSTFSLPAVCFLSVVHPLFDHRFFYKEAPALVEAGYPVILAFPCAAEPAGSPVRVFPLQPPIRRIVRFLYSLWILPRLLKLRADVFHLVDVELLPLGLLLKCLGKKIIYDAHEDIASFMLHKTYLPGFLRVAMSRLVGGIEKAADLWMDGLVLADPGTSHLHPHMPENRKVIFYNFPLKSGFPPRDRLIPASDRLYDFCFLGTMSETSGTFVLLYALAFLKKRHPKFRCLFIGKPDASIQKRLEEFLKEHDLGGNIEITGRIPHGEVPALVNQCRVGLIGLKNLPKFQKNIPTKMFEYWACGLPVIAPRLPPIEMFFDATRHGRLVAPESPKEFSEAMCELMERPDKLERFGPLCREDFETKYHGESQQENLRKFYRRLFGGTSPCAD